MTRYERLCIARRLYRLLLLARWRGDHVAEILLEQRIQAVTR